MTGGMLKRVRHLIRQVSSKSTSRDGQRSVNKPGKPQRQNQVLRFRESICYPKITDVRVQAVCAPGKSNDESGACQQQQSKASLFKDSCQLKAKGLVSRTKMVAF